MKSLLNKKIKDSKGFTLIEILLVTMLMLIVISMLSATYFLAINTSSGNIESATSGSDARNAAYRISKDLREATKLTMAEYSEIKFERKIDTDPYFEVVDYYLADEDGYHNLYRKIGTEDAKIVATKIVKNDLFTYYTDINTPEGGMTSVSEADLGNIKIIEIKLSIDQSGAESPRTMELKTLIALRNKI
jgi:prepilin-type N-terminal cleavage/methylation domain-containing protein